MTHSKTELVEDANECIVSSLYQEGWGTAIGIGRKDLEARKWAQERVCSDSVGRIPCRSESWFVNGVEVQGGTEDVSQEAHGTENPGNRGSGTALGKLTAREAFPGGPGLNVTLADMEEVAMRAARALVGSTVETAVGDQGVAQNDLTVLTPVPF